MIIPVDEFYGQSLVFIEKRKGKLREGKVLPVRFVPMINENGKEY
jgi:protein-L-isoaspartate(D-aspartate) O-methyltransferase